MSLLDELVYLTVLPPKVPDQRFRDAAAVGKALHSKLMDACTAITERVNADLSPVVQRLHKNLAVAQLVKNAAGIDKDVTSNLLPHISELSTEDAIILHVVHQNAGLIIRSGRSVS